MNNYYLGYYENKHYTPINLPSYVGNDILAIVDFTTSFNSVDKLKEYLFENKLIPAKNVRLAYVIEKGKKGEKYYNLLRSNELVYTMLQSRYFKIEWLKTYFNENKYNLNFIAHLYAEYLKKYGITSKIYIYLQTIIDDNTKVYSLLIGIKKIIVSNEIRNKIDKHLERMNNTTFACENDRFFEELTRIIYNYPFDLINLYTYLKRLLVIPNIPTLKTLSHLFAITNHANELGICEYENSFDEHKDINREIQAFFESILYSYDSKKGEYRKENGKRKILSRNIFDLGAFIEGYESYLLEQARLYKKEEVTDYEDEKEEFLEEEDFERMNTTSEEQGYNLRKYPIY